MANVPISNLTTTWNNVATTFTGIKLNVTNTASAAGSLLMDLQIGGASQFSIDKTGKVLLKDGFSLVSSAATTTGLSIANAGNNPEVRVLIGNSQYLVCKQNFVQSAKPLSLSTDTGQPGLGPVLAYDANNTLAQRNGVNAQTHRIYGTYTDGSNYRRLTKTMSTGGVAEIKPEGAGTGASGNVLHISGLPTSNPGPGILWNDAGTVKVGT